MVDKIRGRNGPPPENYVKPVPTPHHKNHRGSGMVSDTTFNRLSPNRKQVIDTLKIMTDPIDNPWVIEVYAAVDDALFEKAARIIHPHSSRLARKMLEG
jgi:hypothetical protein